MVGLGVSTADFLMVVDRFPRRELVQPARSSLLQGGGPVATAMVALERLGSRTAMIDNLGDDWRGKAIFQEFQREGVSTELLRVQKGRTSSAAVVLVRARDGARTIMFSPGDAEEVSGTDPRQEIISSARILHLNGRHLDACLSFVARARKEGVQISFDGGAHRFRPELTDLIRLSDICIVARNFACALAGSEDISLAAKTLLSLGPKLVGITAGIEGSWIHSRDGEEYHQPAFDVGKALDTTGAGDAYHGAFLHGILRNYNIRGCALLASAVSALNVLKLGGRSGLATFDEAAAFLAQRGMALQ